LKQVPVSIQNILHDKKKEANPKSSNIPYLQDQYRQTFHQLMHKSMDELVPIRLKLNTDSFI